MSLDRPAGADLGMAYCFADRAAFVLATGGSVMSPFYRWFVSCRVFVEKRAEIAATNLV